MVPIVLAGGRLDHVLPLVLLHVEHLHPVLAQQRLLVEIVEVVGRAQSLALLEQLALGGAQLTDRSGSLSKMPLISIEGPQLFPSRMLSNRSWQFEKGEL